MTIDNLTTRRSLQVTGQVQGVGFRPLVYRLAIDLGISGWVLNDPAGVMIELQGPGDKLDEFQCELMRQLPPLGRIDDITSKQLVIIDGENGFEILPSLAGPLTDAQITVDTAFCPDCQRELADQNDRRYRYPFINCTNCGPRYSIVEGIPYDRPNTTMADFPMCDFCKSQYEDPANRRFHAQPVACPICGPRVKLTDNKGVLITSKIVADADGERGIADDDPIQAAAKLLIQGKIVAIKGIGGFHLACQADNAQAVKQLRMRKHRDAKPFAVMVEDIEFAKKLCHISPCGQRLLTSPHRPIVLLPRRTNAPVAKGVADGFDTLGIMLPYAPLHLLLLGENTGPLVMTSGNYSDEPLVKDDDSAIAHLGQIADAMLLHNRRIARRIDDSVILPGDDDDYLIFRRARGYAPMPIDLPASTAPAILAVGPELKNTVCLYRNGKAMLSEHIGDLNDGRVYRHYVQTISHLEKLFETKPKILVADLHPAYLSTGYAKKRAKDDESLTVVTVQHHHAHIASVLAEHSCTDRVIGIACDGVGYGDDGTTWGCEVLACDLADYERIGHLRQLPMIGGDIASVECYRPALAALADAAGYDGIAPAVISAMAVEDEKISRGLEMLASRVNCPMSSSLGRIFDAVAGMCGLAGKNRFEGEAAMMLESVIARGVEESYCFALTRSSPFEIDLREMFRQIVADISAGVDVGIIAAKFHNTVVDFLRASVRTARNLTGIATAALSGGCFANRYITRRLIEALTNDDMKVLVNRDIPCNDGGVALGQVAVAAARASHV